MKKRTLWLIAIAIIVFAGLSGGAYYLYEVVLNTDTIYEGIYIEEYYVGGMTIEQAEKYVRTEKESELSEQNMNLRYGNKEYKLFLNDLGLDYDYPRAAEWAFAKYRTGGGPFVRYKEIQRLKDENLEISLKYTYNEYKIKAEVHKIAGEIDLEPVDATIIFEDERFSRTQEKPGIRVIKDELIKSIEDNIEELDDINIPVEDIKPKYTREYYSRINGVLGEFSTSFAGSASGRVENIRISARALNNLVIHPGEEASYNDITGPKIAAYGYKEAPIIFEGELVPGLGGGVCQTSTTLYNTLLLADLDIIERSPHSLPPSYVNLGRDAAVSTGYLDLKFRNNFDFPIFLTSKIVGTRVYFYIYGDAANRDYTVRISEEIVDIRPFTTKEIFDGTMEPGTEKVLQEGRKGYKSKTYKTIIKDGKVVSSKQINSDYYRERQHIVKHGIKIPKNPEGLEEPTNPVESEETEETSTTEKLPEENLDESTDGDIPLDI